MAFPPDEQPEQKSRFLPGAMRNREEVSHSSYACIERHHQPLF
jgi:hypothetical protein